MSHALRPAPWVAVAAIAVGAVAACGTSTPAPQQTAAPRSTGVGCVTSAQATQIWTGIDARLNALEADPKHGGASEVATGAALAQIEQYLAQQLEASNLTETEVDKLDALVVVNPGCNNGTLQLRVSMTLVTDNYVKANGQVDHADPAVGKTLHLLESFVRSGSTWKESATQDLDNPAPTQTPQVI